MESVFRSIIRFRWLVIVPVLNCTGVTWMQLSKLHFDSDMEAMIPPEDPVQSYNNMVEERSMERERLRPASWGTLEMGHLRAASG